jgi:hypothetical protein
MHVMRPVTLGLLLALMLVPPALADGDPASDALIGATIPRVFMSFTAPDPTLEWKLVATTGQVAAAGLPIKVAVIADKNDLGAVPQLFGQPQNYAYYLGAELRFVYRGTLLVVMPQGFGINGPYPLAKARAALADIKPANATAQELTVAADKALRALAAADGRTLAGAHRSGSGGDGVPYATIAIAVLAAIGGGALAVGIDRKLHPRAIRDA